MVKDQPVEVMERMLREHFMVTDADLMAWPRPGPRPGRLAESTPRGRSRPGGGEAGPGHRRRVVELGVR
jgi:hypothetical protein